LLVWSSKKDMLVHYNKLNTSLIISPIEINMKVTLYLKDTTKEMLKVKLLPKFSKLTRLFMKDGTMLISKKDPILTLDSIE
jgi:hypothetical protein